MNKLEKDYFAEIDAWKQKKDDEAYQAKKKAEANASAFLYTKIS